MPGAATTLLSAARSRGGALYGTYPNLQLNGPDDFAGTGSFVPTTALSQYMATLASWFGVPASALPGMLPVPWFHLGPACS